MPVYLLDTDHISLIARGGEEGRRIYQRLSSLAPDEISVSIVSYEEQMRGWLAEIAAARAVDRQKKKYGELERMLKYYCATPILSFDDAAVAVFQHLWIQRLRIGTMDLKIAAIALSNKAILLTRNLNHFNQIPGLQSEDWTL